MDFQKVDFAELTCRLLEKSKSLIHKGSLVHVIIKYRARGFHFAQFFDQ